MKINSVNSIKNNQNYAQKDFTTLNKKKSDNSSPIIANNIASFGGVKNKMTTKDKAIILSFVGALSLYGIPFLMKNANSKLSVPDISKIEMSFTSSEEDDLMNYSYIVEDEEISNLWNENNKSENYMRSLKFTEAATIHDLSLNVLKDEFNKKQTYDGRLIYVYGKQKEPVLKNIEAEYQKLYNTSIDKDAVKNYSNILKKMQSKGLNRFSDMSYMMSPEVKEAMSSTVDWINDFISITNKFPELTEDITSDIIRETKLDKNIPYLRESVKLIHYLTNSELAKIYKSENKISSAVNYPTADTFYRDKIKVQNRIEENRKKELEIKKQEDAKKQAELKKQREIEAEKQRQEKLRQEQIKRQQEMEQEAKRNQEYYEDYYQSLLDDLQSTMNAVNSMYGWY